MQRFTLAFWIASATTLAFCSAAVAQNPPPSSGTANAINGINSYPGPEFVKYPDRALHDQRIDMFLSDWQGSLPRFEHGSAARAAAG